MKTIYLAVISDLVHDQRMQRIFNTLTQGGYMVVMVGRKDNKLSIPSKEYANQVRLTCWFGKGKLMYLEFNLRLFFFLLTKKMDLICAADLDTIVPCYWISRIKKIQRVYDAHELFTEMKEIVRRPNIQKIWKWVERKMVPNFQQGYTVSQSIISYFHQHYGVQYALIRNCPVLTEIPLVTVKTDKWLLYQGAVNEARGLEFLIPAMRKIRLPLRIYGNGNFLQQTKALIQAYDLSDKVTLYNPVSPEELRLITAEAYIGINLVEHVGLNQYYSLANKFFDYIQSGIPQITMRYPAYEQINNEYEVALLIDDLDEESISSAINLLHSDQDLYNRLQANCMQARLVYNWESEEKKLISFYHHLLQ